MVFRRLAPLELIPLLCRRNQGQPPCGRRRVHDGCAGEAARDDGDADSGQSRLRGRNRANGAGRPPSHHHDAAVHEQGAAARRRPGSGWPMGHGQAPAPADFSGRGVAAWRTAGIRRPRPTSTPPSRTSRFRRRASGIDWGRSSMPRTGRPTLWIASKRSKVSTRTRKSRFGALGWCGLLEDLRGHRDAALAYYRKALADDPGSAMNHERLEDSDRPRLARAEAENSFQARIGARPLGASDECRAYVHSE